MARKQHKPEEIAAKLRQVEVLTAQGRMVAEGARAIGVTEVTCPRRSGPLVMYSAEAMRRLGLVVRVQR